MHKDPLPLTSILPGSQLKEYKVRPKLFRLRLRKWNNHVNCKRLADVCGLWFKRKPVNLKHLKVPTKSL